MISLRNWAKLKVLVLVPVIAWLGGCSCAGSLRPLESGAPPLESANLRGKWVSTDDSSNQQEYFLVDSASADVYVVSSLKPNEKLTDVYEVSLVQVGSYTFLDAAFDETESGQEHRSVHDMGALPIHFIGRVWVEGDTLRLGLLNYDWLKQMISTGKVTLPSIEHHEDNDCRVGGGALARWPPSAAQTARAGFPRAAFTKTHDLRCKQTATVKWASLTSVGLSRASSILGR